jgi:hypothetical protein
MVRFLLLSYNVEQMEGEIVSFLYKWNNSFFRVIFLVDLFQQSSQLLRDFVTDLNS